MTTKVRITKLDDHDTPVEVIVQTAGTPDAVGATLVRKDEHIDLYVYDGQQIHVREVPPSQG